MNDPLAYIEAYFEKQLSEADMREFERQCEQDEDFARDVALYVTTREALRQTLLEKKRQQWSALGSARKPETAAAPVRMLSIRSWIPYAAAACLLLFVAVYFFNSRQTLNRQVAGYVQEELSSVSPTMGSLTDSMELGKQHLKSKEYGQALQIFTIKAKADKTNDDALLFQGYAYRAANKYDSALASFNELGGRTQLSINKGPYNAALTLLQRNKSGDKKIATALLQKVVADSLYGSQEAAGLLDLLK